MPLLYRLLGVNFRWSRAVEPGHRPRLAAGRCKQRTVEIGKYRLDRGDGKARVESRIRGRAEAPPQRRISGKLHQYPRGGTDIAERHQIAFASLTDHLPTAGNVGRDDRSAGGSCFHQAFREPFPHRQQYRDVVLAMDPRHIVSGAVPIYARRAGPSPQVGFNVRGWIRRIGGAEKMELDRCAELHGHAEPRPPPRRCPWA